MTKILPSPQNTPDSFPGNDESEDMHSWSFRIADKMSSMMVKNGGCRYFSAALASLLLLTFMVMPLFGNTEPGEFDWIVSSSKYSEDQDAVENAFLNADKVSDGAIGSRADASFIHSLIYLYEWDNGRNEEFINAANLQVMCQTEGKMATFDQYQGQRGVAESGGGGDKQKCRWCRRKFRSHGHRFGRSVPIVITSPSLLTFSPISRIYRHMRGQS